MRAVTMKHGRLELKDVPEPRLGPGQLLVEPLAAGVCGGDLNALTLTDAFLDASRRSNMRTFIFDPDRDVVFGHEFSSRVLEVGAGVDAYAPGDLLLNLPLAIDPDGVTHCVGYASDYPGGLGERVVVQAFGQLKIPPGMSPYLPAIVDPLATGLNGVVRSKIEGPAGAIVTGCGPVGMGAVWELARRGITPIVASDPSPARRALALEFGADIAVDPAIDDPIAAWRDLAPTGAGLYLYECAGKAGLLNHLLDGVPPFTRITVVGACMTDDVFSPLVAIYKNVTIEFSMGAGPDTEYQFGTTFDHIVAGRLPAHRLVTGYAGLEGVEEVFARLRPGAYHDIDHMKILVRHDLDGPGIRTPAEVGESG
jgi:threonine dehydrogenase-like Zn-dependent dehydrogenase